MPESFFVFDWDEVATESLCRQVEQAVGIGDGPVEHMVPLVRRILSLIGGLPVSRFELSADECTALGERLLLEACCHTLSALSVHWDRRGYLLDGNRVVDVDRVNVNAADADTLATLPRVGKELAERIIEERLRHGVFLSIEDVDRRVQGIGENLANVLRNAVSCATPAEEWRTLPYGATELPDCLRVLVSRTQEPDARTRLLRALEIVASTCASAPHPAVRGKRVRDFVEHRGTLHATDELTVLVGSSYYNVTLDRICAAKTSVSACMFHIAMPEEKHPTRGLLDALIEAHDRNVAVRVLVDRDDKTDPYRSEIINRPALDLLAKHGVSTRSDARDRLLHSKFVVIDDADVIIGSHNWSAGSYFQFDDASVLVSSAEFAAAMSQRFDELWEKASA